jgi:hypothetical protein
MSMGGDQMGAPVVWLEVAGRDLDALRQFYGSLFGWRIELDPAAPIPYGLVHTDAEGGIPGGGVYAPASRWAATSCSTSPWTTWSGRCSRPRRWGPRWPSRRRRLADGSRVAMINDPRGPPHRGSMAKLTAAGDDAARPKEVRRTTAELVTT